MSCIVCFDENANCSHTQEEYFETLIYAQDQTTRATRAIAKLLLIPATASILGSVLIVLGIFVLNSTELVVAGWITIGLGTIWGVVEGWFEFNKSASIN